MLIFQKANQVFCCASQPPAYPPRPSPGETWALTKSMNKEVTIPTGQGSTWYFYLCRFYQWTLLINAVFISPTRAGSAARPHMPYDYTVHGPREPTVLWDPGFFMCKTTGTQLSQHIVIFLSVKFPYSTMKEPSTPNYHFIFLKGPISGWAVSAKYLALSCFILFPARARRALCQRKQPSHFKDETQSPAISCLVQGHGEQRGRELHLGSWLLQHRLRLHQSRFGYMQKHNWNLSKFSFTFRW